MNNTKTLNNIEAINDALTLMMEQDPNIIVYGEDVGQEGGVFRATKGLQTKFGKQRCFDSPLDEATIMGVAVGMSLNNLKPVCEIQFQGFTYNAFQNLFGHAARYRNRTRGRYSCPLVLRMPMGGGIRAIEHHSESIETLFAHIPGLKVVIPSTPYDSKGLLISAINDPDPVVFLEPKRVYRAFKQVIPSNYYEVPIGKANVIISGTDLTIVSYGAITHEIIPAIEKFKDLYSIELIDLRTIKPWDKEAVIDSVKKTGRLLVIHEAVNSFSVASEIISYVSQNAFYFLKIAPQKLTSPDITIPLACGEQLILITADKIIDRINHIMTIES